MKQKPAPGQQKIHPIYRLLKKREAKTEVSEAEILSAVKVVLSYSSFNFSSDVGKLFKTMFHGSIVTLFSTSLLVLANDYDLF